MKNYNVCSLSCSGHEAGATILKNGEIYEMILEERLSGKKRDNFLFYTFEHLKSFHDKYGLDEIILINGEDTEFNDMIDMLEKYKLKHIKRHEEVQEHHLYHAASGFYASGFEEAVCIVIDGWGADYRVDTLLKMANIYDTLSEKEQENTREWGDLMFLESTSIYQASYPNSLECVWKNLIVPPPQPRGFIEVNFPNDFFEMLQECEDIEVNSCYDIGIMYGTVTYHLGWHRDECGKTMGLSAYGKPNEEFPAFILDNGMANMNVFYSNRLFNTTNFPILRHKGDFQKKADIAWEVQKCMEDVLRMRVRQVLDKSPETKNIVFSGGCALNICANSVVQEEFPDINFFIDPIAGDACQSLGAAKAYHHDKTQDCTIRPLDSIYKGKIQPPKPLFRKQIELEVARQNTLGYN